MDPTGKLNHTNFLQNAYQVGIAQNTAIPGKDKDDTREVEKRGHSAAEQTGEGGRKGKELEAEADDEIFLPATLEDAKQFREMDMLKQMAQGVREEDSGNDAAPKMLALPPGSSRGEIDPKGAVTISVDGGPPIEARPVDKNFLESGGEIIDAEFTVVDDGSKTPKGSQFASSTDKSGAKAGLKPPVFPDGAKQYRNYESISTENKQILKDVFSGRLPLQFVPELPLEQAGDRLRTLVDFTLKDQGDNKEISFWKKWMMKSPRKTMMEYDRFARIMTERQMAQNPKLDKEKLHLYNVSHVILNDKDRMTGKPKMQNMATSAFQYVRAYESEAAMQAGRRGPSQAPADNLESLLSGLSTQEQEAVLQKDRELNDTAMLMAARGKPLSPEDLEALRASNLVELGRQGKVNSKVADKAKEYLMNSQNIDEMPGEYSAYGVNPQDPRMSGQFPQAPPGSPGNFVPPGPVPPGTQPPGTPGHFPVPQDDMSGFMAMMMAQERASRMSSSLMMMLVGGPFMIPYALMMNLMPSSIPYMANVMRPIQPPQFPGPQFPGQQFPGQQPNPGSMPQVPNMRRTSGSYRQPPLLEREEESWLDAGSKKGGSWLDIKKDDKKEAGEEEESQES